MRKFSFSFLALLLFATFESAQSDTIRVSRSKGLRYKSKEDCLTRCAAYGETYHWCYVSWKTWDYCDLSPSDRVVEAKQTKEGRTCISTCGKHGGTYYNWCFRGHEHWDYCE